MKIENKISLADWQEAADKCEHATFFHTPVWSEIFAKTYKYYKPSARKFIFKDGKEAILPLMKISRLKGMINAYVSNVAGTYGGYISRSILSTDQIEQIFNNLRSPAISKVTITGNPLNKYNAPITYGAMPCSTHILNLQEGIDALWDKWGYQMKKAIKKASEAGMEYRIAENLDEWREYFAIYEQALEKWGDRASSRYPFSLFENFFNSENKNIKLWLATLNGKIIGGHLYLYHNYHCAEWHSCFLDEFLELGTRRYLIHQTILDACSKNIKYYDLSPSGGHQGPEQFKQRFHPNRITFSSWSWDNPVKKFWGSSRI